MHNSHPIRWASLGGLILLMSACGKPAPESAAVENNPGPASVESVPSQPSGMRFDTVDQKASYGLGLGMGSNLAGQTVISIDEEILIAGIRDGLAAVEPRLDEATLEAAFAELEGRAQARKAEADKATLLAGQAFLEKNAGRPEVVETDSGLQYEILESASDPEAKKPTAEDMVVVHYHGTLVDGTVFDSSIERDQPLTLPVGEVIQGWVEALQLMSVGDVWKVYVPPALGYGDQQAGRIPANSVLVFEIRLLSIVEDGE